MMRVAERAQLFTVAIISLLMSSAQAANTPQPLDLGASADQIRQRLGIPQQEWSVQLCPDYRIERHVRGTRVLKLVFDARQRWIAMGIANLARPTPPPAWPAAWTAAWPHTRALNWPGLAPGLAKPETYHRYPGLRPWFYTLGAKQLLWYERDTGVPASRERYVGAVTINDASYFATGASFPFQAALLATAPTARGLLIAQDQVMAPLHAWRRRQHPNALVEILADESRPTECDALLLAGIDYRDM